MHDAHAVSWPELAAVVLSRELRNGEVGSPGGSRSEIPLAAARLAQALHAPDMTIITSAAGCVMNSVDKPWSPMYHSTTDFRNTYAGVEAMMPFHTLFLSRRDWFFAGGLQVDAYGNLNMNRIVGDNGELIMQGPGAAALPSATGNAERFYIYMQQHSPRSFVRTLGYRSAVGYGDGPGYRESLGLRGGGPALVVSPLATMDFDESSRRMRLKSIHPGHTLDEVIQATGFELIVPEHVPETEGPSATEIEVLRAKIDKQGVLKR